MTAAFEAWRDEDTPATCTFAFEMTWKMVGRSEAPRCYPNKEECIDEVLAAFGRLSPQ